jgi:hypothetical protein
MQGRMPARQEAHKAAPTCVARVQAAETMRLRCPIVEKGFAHCDDGPGPGA